jgi:hypothetical protein
MDFVFLAVGPLMRYALYSIEAEPVVSTMHVYQRP